MKIAVCGAGRGGMTLAADMSLMGHEVRLFQLPQFRHTLDILKPNRTLEIYGPTAAGKEGEARIHLATTDPVEALTGAEAVVFVLPAFGHETMFSTVIPHLENGQTLLVCTGYWSSLRFRAMLAEHHKDVIMAEFELLPYLTGDFDDNVLHVAALKTHFRLAAFPASKTEAALAVAHQMYPQVMASQNVLEVNAICLNYIMHTPLILTNLSVIEKANGFNFYGSGNSRKACTLMEAIDEEKIAFGKIFGMQFETLVETNNIVYPNPDPQDKDIYQLLAEEDHSSGFSVSLELAAEMNAEDIPFSMVPLVTIAEQFNVDLPIMRSLVNIFSALNGRDYWEIGLTPEKLGIEKMSVEDIIALVNN